MKNLKDFISEEDKKKEGIQPDKKGEDRGADDKKYIIMMEKYKTMRRKDAKGANALLAKAFKLAKEGDVSKRAITAGAYI